MYVTPAIIGAVTVSGIKFLTDHSTPEIAAILGAAPIGYLSTLFIDGNKKTTDYLFNYALFLAFTIIGAITYMMCMKKLHKIPSLFAGIGVIVTAILIRLAVPSPQKK